MSDLFGAMRSGLNTINPFASDPHQSIAPSLPQYTQQLQAKYARIGGSLQSIPDPIRNALINMDAQRVSQGKAPLSDADTAAILQSAVTNSPVTPPPRRNILNIPGNALHDLGDIVKSVPRLPAALIHEVKDLPNIATRIQEAKAKGDNDIAALLSAPGVRLIPGSYLLGNLARGGAGVREAATHPLMSALDVLPAASKAAELSRVGRAATTAAEEAGRTARPLAAVLTKKLDGAGQLIPNRFGAELKSLQENSRVGQVMTKFFGNHDVFRQAELIKQRQITIRQGLIDAGVPGDLAHSAATLNERHPGLNLADPAYDADLSRRIQSGDMASFTPEELAYKRDYHNVVTGIGEHMANQESPQLFIHDGEFFNREQYLPMRKATELLRKVSDLHSIRQSITAGTADPTSTLTRMSQLIDTPRPSAALFSKDEQAAALAAGQMSRRELQKQLTGYIYALQAAGYEVSDLQSELAHAGRTHDYSTLRSRLDGYPLQQSNVTPIADIHAAIDRESRTGIQAKVLQVALNDRQWSRASDTLRNIARRYGDSQIEEFNNPAFLDGLKQYIKRERFNDTLPDAKRLGRVTDITGRVLDRTIPARWVPPVTRESNIKYALSHGATEADAANVADRTLKDWLTFDPTFDHDAYVGLRDEVAATWRDMREKGLNPEFAHVVSPGQARQINNPTISETPTTITAVRKRSLDFSPGVQSLSVALNQQAMEVLQRMGSEELMDFVGKSHGIKEAEFEAGLSERATSLAQSDPTLNYSKHLEQLMRRTRVPFDPAQYGANWQSARLRQITQDRYWIPKPLAEQLKSYHDPKSLLNGVFDPSTRLFRMAVIGLSPRTQLYNILGGATMVAGEAGFRAFKYIPEARRMLKDPSLIPNESLRAMIGSQKRSIMEEGVRELSTSQVDGVMKYLTGRTMRRLMDQIQSSKVLGAADKAADWSLSLNGKFDDAYRIMSYLQGRDKSLMKGLSKSAAENAGIELARKTLMEWGAMTPAERTILKTIFPFYGFISHAIRYVLRYPVDHPLRAEIMGRFAQAELQDMNDTLPSRFLAALPLGHVDSEGHQGFLQMAAVNPFGDIANTMTLAGFLGATNPIINTILESVGVQRGQAELYPSLQYDGNSGRLTAKHPNPLMSLIQNTIPQSDILMALTGASADFNDQLRRDPAGAMRHLASAGGVPVVYRSINVPQEQFRTELARTSADKIVQQSALQSGDWSDALNHPAVAAYLQNVNQLPADVLKQYVPQSQNAYADYVKQHFADAGGI